MSQKLITPGPSRSEFNALSDQIGTLNSNLAPFLDGRSGITDLNNAINPGLYGYGASAQNVPFNYGVVYVMNYSTGGWIVQVAFGITADKMSYRVKNGGTWGSWVTIK